MRSKTPSTARLEARISKELHATLKRAADLQNRTMTDFIIAAVQEAAIHAIEQAEMIRLSLADQENFAEAWTMIEPDALSLLSDKESMTDRITDAGLDPDTLPGCTLKNWQALQNVLDSCVPAVNGEE